MKNLVFVDCEARGASPVGGTLTEFGAVHYGSRDTFYGKIYESTPDPVNPAIPLVGNQIEDPVMVAVEFEQWLIAHCKSRPIFVSDNPAYDWQWISALFAVAGIQNPFGHSGRRIADFWAGLNYNFGETQSWKKFRKTVHDHNPVNDAMGNAEAFEKIMELVKEKRNG